MTTQHQSCMEIEHFVENALNYKKPKRNQALNYFCLLKNCYSKISSNNYKMNDKLSVFYGVFNFDFLPFSITDNKTAFRYLNDGAAAIRDMYYKKPISRIRSDLSYRSLELVKKITSFTSNILHNRKVMILRLDLHYRSNLDISIDRVCDDIEYFLYTLRRAKNKDLMNGVLGYLWQIEQGNQRGFHIHTAFFFNPKYVRSDYYKAESLGSIWSEITQQYGYHYNCNASRGSYNRLGIGIINGNNEQERSNAISAMIYLAKETQALRVKPKHRRSFGASGE